MLVKELPNPEQGRVADSEEGTSPSVLAAQSGETYCDASVVYKDGDGFFKLSGNGLEHSLDLQGQECVK